MSIISLGLDVGKAASSSDVAGTVAIGVSIVSLGLDVGKGPKLFRSRIFISRALKEAAAPSGDGGGLDSDDPEVPEELL